MGSSLDLLSCIVIRYDGAFYHDIKERPADEQAAFHAAYPTSGTYLYSAFKEHVRQALRAKFGDSVKPGSKAIKIEGNDNRRNEVHDLPDHTRYCPSAAGRIEFLSFCSATGLQKLNFRVADYSGT